MLEPCQEARMESATGELGDIVSGYQVLKSELHGSELLQSHIPEAKLPELSLPTRIYITISGQEAGVLQATVDLDHLFIVLEADIDSLWHVLTGFAHSKGSVLRLSPAISLPFHVNRDGVRLASRYLHDALQRLDELRLCHSIQARLLHAKSKDTMLVSAHRVDVAIL